MIHACLYGIGASNSTQWVRFDDEMKRQNLSVAKVYSPPIANLSIPPCLRPVERESFGRLVSYASLWNTYNTVWKAAIETCPHDYTVVFEDDALLPFADFSLRLDRITARAHVDVAWFDTRVAGQTIPGCCTVAMLYRNKVLPTLVKEFDLTNRDAYWNGYERASKTIVNDSVCLTDFYLSNTVARHGLRTEALPLVVHRPRTETFNPPSLLFGRHVRRLFGK